MKKKLIRFSIFPIFLAFIFYSFSAGKKAAVTTGNEANFFTSDLPDFYSVPEKSELIFFGGEIPKLGKGYVAFKEAVGFKESRGSYKVINQFGYMGKYQFGKGTLAMVGIYNIQKFMRSPKLQEAAFYANASRNKWILKDEIEEYVGKTMYGVKITESGIIAAAHLAGAGGVSRYLRNGYYFSDAFGTTVKYYLNKFKGYDTSFVMAIRNAKV